MVAAGKEAAPGGCFLVGSDVVEGFPVEGGVARAPALDRGGGASAWGAAEGEGSCGALRRLDPP